MPKSAVWLCGMKKGRVVGKATGKWGMGMKIDSEGLLKLLAFILIELGL